MNQDGRSGKQLVVKAMVPGPIVCPGHPLVSALYAIASIAYVLPWRALVRTGLFECTNLTEARQSISLLTLK
jgi:hypothetical protein